MSRILAEIDAQIEKLQQARSILAGGSTPVVLKRSVGRPRKDNASLAPPVKEAVSPKRQRNLSPEARKRIADAQRRRWAEHHKSAPDGR